MRMRHLSYKHEFWRCFYIWAANQHIACPLAIQSVSIISHLRQKLLTVCFLLYLHLLDNFVMSHFLHGFLYNSGSTIRPPPRLSSKLPPVLLSKSHPIARGHSLGLPRMWQHHAISKVPHLTAPPQECHWKLHTCTTTTAKTMYT